MPSSSANVEEEHQMDATRDLNAEETDKLVQLQDLTGIDDVHICRALLESKDWDLEATAREHLGLQHPAHSRSSPSAPERPLEPHPVAPNARIIRSANLNNNVNNNNNNNNIVAQNGGWLAYFLDLASLPVTLPLRIILAVFRGFADFFGFRNDFQPRRRNNRASSSSSNGALEDVRRFISTFEAKFGRSHPEFMLGSYTQALEKAKKELRFLFVYLHHESHQDTPQFCERILSNPALTEFVRDSGALTWACDVTSAEGYRVSQALRESTYPFLAVIVLRQHRMTAVGRLEGGWSDAAAFVDKLRGVVNDHEASIVAARAEREERAMNQNIREEQDAAFRETLRQDQEKEKKKQEAEEAKQRLEQEEKDRIKKEEERKERIRAAKMDFIGRIPDEPDLKHPEAVRILIKLPEGQRLERRFLKSEPLESLYYWVFCHPDSPDDFDITTNFPRKVLRCKPKDAELVLGRDDDEPSQELFCGETLESAGLGQSSMLFVHDLEA